MFWELTGKADHNHFSMKTWSVFSITTQKISEVDLELLPSDKPPELWERYSSVRCCGWCHLLYQLLFHMSSSGGALTNKSLDDFKNSREVCLLNVLACVLIQTRHSLKTSSRCLFNPQLFFQNITLKPLQCPIFLSQTYWNIKEPQQVRLERLICLRVTEKEIGVWRRKLDTPWMPL